MEAFEGKLDDMLEHHLNWGRTASLHRLELEGKERDRIRASILDDVAALVLAATDAAKLIRGEWPEDVNFRVEEIMAALDDAIARIEGGDHVGES